MQTFEEIVANALTSREEVEMVSNARIGAEYDIRNEAEEVIASADTLVKYARFQAFFANPNPGTNPFGLR